MPGFGFVTVYHNVALTFMDKYRGHLSNWSHSQLLFGAVLKGAEKAKIKGEG
jgi:hypothetical protein